MTRRRIAVLVGVATWLFLNGTLRAGPISIPNASFESPVTTFVNPNIDSWAKPPKPDWYDESGGFLWTQLAGVFLNTPATNSDHIDNCDGNQAAYLFVVPEVALFQDYNSIDWSHTAPTHAFNATFNPGSSYQLTVGLIGGGGGMLEGASVELSLYYRDNASNMVTVAATNIVFTLARFPTTTHLIDCQLNLPAVQTGDAWAGQNIGIQLLSTVTTNLEGGYWDLDNFRLIETGAPILTNPGSSNGQFHFTLQSEPGLTFAILAATNIAPPLTNWTMLAVLTNVNGASMFTDSTAGVEGRFYRARQLP